MTGPNAYRNDYRTAREVFATEFDAGRVLPAFESYLLEAACFRRSSPAA